MITIYVQKDNSTYTSASETGTQSFQNFAKHQISVCTDWFSGHHLLLCLLDWTSTLKTWLPMLKPVSKHSLAMEANNIQPAPLATSVCLFRKSLKSEGCTNQAKVAKSHGPKEALIGQVLDNHEIVCWPLFFQLQWRNLSLHSAAMQEDKTACGEAEWCHEPGWQTKGHCS